LLIDSLSKSRMNDNRPVVFSGCKAFSEFTRVGDIDPFNFSVFSDDSLSVISLQHS
jgi:hypothetical protein